MIATRIFRSHFVSPDGRELRAWFLGRICSRSRSIHKLCYLPRCFKCSILGKRSRYRDETKWSFIGVFPTNYNRTFKFYVRSFLTHKKKIRKRVEQMEKSGSKCKDCGNDIRRTFWPVVRRGERGYGRKYGEPSGSSGSSSGTGLVRKARGPRPRIPEGRGQQVSGKRRVTSTFAPPDLRQ